MEALFYSVSTRYNLSVIGTQTLLTLQLVATQQISTNITGQENYEQQRSLPK